MMSEHRHQPLPPWRAVLGRMAPSITLDLGPGDDRLPRTGRDELGYLLCERRNDPLPDLRAKSQEVLRKLASKPPLWGFCRIF